MGTQDVIEDVLLDSALTEDELLEDISEAQAAALESLEQGDIEYSLYRDGDLTTRIVADRRNISVRSAINYMRGKAKEHPDKWEYIRVVKVAGNRNWFCVLRQKDNKG